MQRKSIIPINGQLYSMLIVSALSMGTLPSFAENSLTVQNVLQSKKVKGQVTDVNGEPIIGATVTLKGTNQRTVTDLDGNFEFPNVTKGGCGCILRRLQDSRASCYMMISPYILLASMIMPLIICKFIHQMP